jgi:hypothetical protein
MSELYINFYELPELHKLNILEVIYCRQIKRWTFNEKITYIVQNVLQVSDFFKIYL